MPRSAADGDQRAVANWCGCAWRATTAVDGLVAKTLEQTRRTTTRRSREPILSDDLRR